VRLPAAWSCLPSDSQRHGMLWGDKRASGKPSAGRVVRFATGPCGTVTVAKAIRSKSPWLWAAAVGLGGLAFAGAWFGRAWFAPEPEQAPIFAAGAPPLQLIGRALVVDGDTLDLGDQRIRLNGIDAPESAQWCTANGRTWPCGREATVALSRLVEGRQVRCEPRGSHRERVVAVCTVDGRDVARLMVEQGWALDWPRYSYGAYAAAEATARTARAGIWRGEFTKPWEWRAERRQRASSAWQGLNEFIQ
jgi:endonuclease YncB( thermonuclease family)